MNLLRWFRGMVTVEIISAEPETLLRTIARSGIAISHIEKKTDLVYRFQIYRKDLSGLATISQKRADKLTVLRKQGLYWKLKALKKRPVLPALFALLLTLTLFLPTRILFFQVSGNEAVSTKKILEAARDCGISFGVRRSQIRSEKVKNELLEALPQLQWAGVNTAGCRAVISVKERSAPEEPAQEHIVSSLIADRDAYILSATVTAGTAMVQPGDTVTRGQLLISGFTDCGLSIQATRAAGEILGQTRRSLITVIPSQRRSILEENVISRDLSLLIGKKRINFWKDSRISGSGCGRMYEEYFVSLPGGFSLPIAICVDRYLEYEIENTAVPREEASRMLQQCTDAYLLRQMTAGQILHKAQKLTCSSGIHQMQSDYVCREIIGTERREQIGDLNGKRD